MNKPDSVGIAFLIMAAFPEGSPEDLRAYGSAAISDSLDPSITEAEVLERMAAVLRTLTLDDAVLSKPNN